MMIIDKEKCISCGGCVKDCFPKDIKMIVGHPNVKYKRTVPRKKADRCWK